MTIRIILRALPLVIVAMLTLGALVEELPTERGQEMARLNAHRLAWGADGVNCPELRGNPGFSACLAAVPSTNAGVKH